jgi:lipopolysaccharide biosynthesis protein
MRLIYQKQELVNSKGLWCIYAHYDKNNSIEAYVTDALQKISCSGFNTIFVSTSSSLSQDSVNGIKDVCTAIIVRDNIGYDFGSYKTGIEFLLKSKVRCDKILISNDSVYGPFSDITDLVERSDNFDIFGLTDSTDINYHLQSYFIIYNKNVIQDKSFRKFWSSVQLLSADQPDFKRRIISDYEVGGSQFFMKQGFRIGANHSFRKISALIFAEFLLDVERSEKRPGHHIAKFTLEQNLAHSYWKILIRNKFPYVKRELLLTNPMNTDISDWPTIIKRYSDYDVGIIVDSLLTQTESIDFAYTSVPAARIARSLIHGDEFMLAINPHFKPYFKSQSCEAFRHYVFDEDYYLCHNPDVSASVGIKETKSGLEHFLRYGHKENRRYSLIYRPRS